MSSLQLIQHDGQYVQLRIIDAIGFSVDRKQHFFCLSLAAPNHTWMSDRRARSDSSGVYFERHPTFQKLFKERNPFAWIGVPMTMNGLLVGMFLWCRATMPLCKQPRSLVCKGITSWLHRAAAVPYSPLEVPPLGDRVVQWRNENWNWLRGEDVTIIYGMARDATHKGGHFEGRLLCLCRSRTWILYGPPMRRG